jgi:hypothetical protein
MRAASTPLSAGISISILTRSMSLRSMLVPMQATTTGDSAGRLAEGGNWPPVVCLHSIPCTHWSSCHAHGMCAAPPLGACHQAGRMFRSGCLCPAGTRPPCWLHVGGPHGLWRRSLACCSAGRRRRRWRWLGELSADDCNSESCTLRTVAVMLPFTYRLAEAPAVVRGVAVRNATAY